MRPKLMTLRSTLLLCAAAACAPCFGQDLVIPWPKGGSYLGHGYDLHTAEFKNSQCVDAKLKPAGGSAGPARRTTFDVHELRSSAKPIDVMPSRGAGSMLTAEAVRASARHAFTERLSADEKTATIVAAVSMAGTQEVAEIATAPILLSASTGESFRNVCGTHFIAEINYGGELWLAFSRRVSNKVEASRFYSDLRAALPAWSGGASNAASRRLESISSEIMVIGQQAGTDEAARYSLRDAIAAYRTFPEQVAKKPGSIVSVTVRPYPHPPFDVSLNASLLGTAVDMLRRYEVLDERARLVADAPDRFDIEADSVGLFDKFRFRLHARTAAIREEIKRCAGASARGDFYHASCHQLTQYRRPPPAAEQDMPADFGVACSKQKEVGFDPVFLDSADFKPRTGDLKIGPNTARFDVDLAGTLNGYPRRLLVSGKVRMHQPAGPARDDHVATLRGLVMNHSAAGCTIDSSAWVDRRSKQSDLALAELGDSAGNDKFDLALANDGAALVDRVNCWINPRSGAAAKQRPRCTIHFKPVPAAALVPVGLVQEGGRTRARKPFAMPSWFD